MKKFITTQAIQSSAAAALLGIFTASANAAVLQFQFSGIVEDVPAILASEFTAGETITGIFSVNTTLNGFLNYDASGLSLSIGGDYGVTGQVGSLSIGNGSGGGPDSFHASFDGPLTGAVVNGRAPVEFDLSLLLPGTAFSSVAVPLSIPLGNALSTLSSIDFAPLDEDTLTFRVNSVVAVPEPALVGMLGAGGLLLASCRRRRVGD